MKNYSKCCIAKARGIEIDLLFFHQLSKKSNPVFLIGEISSLSTSSFSSPELLEFWVEILVAGDLSGGGGGGPAQGLAEGGGGGGADGLDTLSEGGCGGWGGSGGAQTGLQTPFKEDLKQYFIDYLLTLKMKSLLCGTAY